MQIHYQVNWNKALVVNRKCIFSEKTRQSSRVSLLIKSKPNWQTDRNQDQKAQSRLRQGSRDPPTEGLRGEASLEAAHWAPGPASDVTYETCCLWHRTISPQSEPEVKMRNCHNWALFSSIILRRQQHTGYERSIQTGGESRDDQNSEWAEHEGE